MKEEIANQVVELLRAQRIFAAVNRRAGPYNVGLRVVLPDGREAIWDNDDVPGLEAMVLRDGVLVGFVPQMANTEDLTAEQITAIIAGTDYDAPPEPTPPAHPTAAPGGVQADGQAGVPSARPAPAPAKKWSDRLKRR